MSRRSVRAYVNSILQTNTMSISVSAYLPKAQPLVDTAVVLRMTSHEERAKGGTMPRGAGHKLVTHKISIGIANSDVDESAVVLHHDDLVQNILYLFRTTTISSPLVQLVDDTATPNETSYVKYIGEVLDIEQDTTQQLTTTKGAEAEVIALSTLVITLQEELVGV